MTAPGSARNTGCTARRRPGRQQLKGLDTVNQLVEKNVRAMNDPLTKLANVTERTAARPETGLLHRNMLLIDFKKVGFSRDALVKALKAEGVDVSFWTTRSSTSSRSISEAKWWNHPPKIPESMPATPTSTATTSSCRSSTARPRADAQYVPGLEKVWAHRTNWPRRKRNTD